jgi:hypothetical protein
VDAALRWYRDLQTVRAVVRTLIGRVEKKKWTELRGREIYPGNAASLALFRGLGFEPQPSRRQPWSSTCAGNQLPHGDSRHLPGFSSRGPVMRASRVSSE